MKPIDSTLNSEPGGASPNKIRWLSFSFLQNFDFVSHGFIIKSKETNLSTSARKKSLQRLFKKNSSQKKQIIVPQQVHANGCLVIKKRDELKRKYKGDAIITDRKDIFLTISVADCLPIFLVDPKRKVVGLVHAGWRGTLLGIAKETVRKAQGEFGCNPKDLTLLFGPAIQKCCYEISESIALLFDNDCLIRMPDRKPQLDLIHANVKQFLNCGVKRNNIFATNDCTCCNKEMFHSFRRDGDEAGRMIAFLEIK
jgi:YfiH family protein